MTQTRACLQRSWSELREAGGVSRKQLLTDEQWALVEPLLPPQRSGRGRPMRDHRQVVEGVIYRYRCGIAWRDLPAVVVRSVADGVEAAPPLQRRRDLGQDHGRAAHPG